MSVFEYMGNLTELNERGAIHTIAEQVPGRGGKMRPEWRDEQDGFAVTLTLFSPDGDEASVRLTADEVFRIALDLMRDYSLVRYGSG